MPSYRPEWFLTTQSMTTGTQSIDQMMKTKPNVALIRQQKLQLGFERTTNDMYHINILQVGINQTTKMMKTKSILNTLHYLP